MAQQDRMTLQQLEDALIIDEHQLEFEHKRNGGLFYRVSKEVVAAVSLRDEAKQKLKEIQAEVDLEIRRFAARREEKRTPEGELASLLINDPRVKKATLEILQLTKDAANWSALKEAYEQRSYALSKMTDLYIANYYSNLDNKSSGRKPSIQDAKAERIREDMNKKRRETPT